MLFTLIVLVLLLHHRRWYGYGPYWNTPYYRGYGPYGPAHYGYTWNGYAWQPAYPYGAGYYGYPYGYCRRRPFFW